MTPLTPDEWASHHDFESEWWGDCTNTFSEECKQLTYANRMGLVVVANGDSDQWPWYDLAGARVLDIGGGPSSMLLKCFNRGDGCTVVDPLPVPGWVRGRYSRAGIDFVNETAEEVAADAVHLADGCFDEVWIYNCLQHTLDPEAILRFAKRVGKRLRLFEPNDTAPHLGHPQTLTWGAVTAILGYSPSFVTELINENGYRGFGMHGRWEFDSA